MPDIEHTQCINPNDAERGTKYEVAFPEVHKQTIVSVNGHICLQPSVTSLKKGDIVVTERKLIDFANLANITGYHALCSETVFSMLDSEEEFLMPNVPCLAPAKG